MPILILYHKHPTSARTRFLRFAHGGVCNSGPLPADAELVPPPTLHTHPAMLLRTAAAELGMPADALVPDTGFRCGVRMGAQDEEVHLAQFTGVDPPFAEADAQGATFIDLVQARRQPSAELLLLRRAYEHVLG